MKLENEIKNFLRDLGVEAMGIAGPGRFDGPPSLDPDYIMKGAKSIVSYAVPFDVQAIHDYLSKKSAIPHNIDQIRKHQRSMHIALKLAKFLEEKGCRAKSILPNIEYRRGPNPLAFIPKFSHRFGAYVSGMAAPGVSGNAMTKEYGAGVVLNTVFTDAELKSDPVLDPRYFYDTLCEHCMACKASCPPKMFDADKEEYALINGQLYPRAQKRDVNLCSVSCGGLHAPSPDKKWSSWGKEWIDSWVGVEPDPEKQNIAAQLFLGFGTTLDAMARFQPIFEFYGKVYEEGLFEDPKRFPDYEDLPGETEGQKLRSYADVLEKILGIHIDDPISMTCGQCNLVCGPTAEESKKRWKMLSNSGILCYKEGNEPYFTRDFEEAAALHKAYKYKVSAGVKRQWLGHQMRLFVKMVGLNLHTIRNKKKYEQKLAGAVAEMEESRQRSGETVNHTHLKEGTTNT